MTSNSMRNALMTVDKDDIDLQRLLGKHDIDTSLFDRSLKRLAMTNEQNKASIVPVETAYQMQHVQDPLSGFITQGYHSNLEIAVGNAVDKTLLRAERQNAQEISNFASNGLRHAIETVFEPVTQPKLTNGDIERSKMPHMFLMPGAASTERPKTNLPLVVGNKKANDFYKILENDVLDAPMSSEEFAKAHLKIIKSSEYSNPSEIEVWEIVTELCLKKNYNQIMLNHLETEFKLYITQSFPNFGNTLNKDLVLNFLVCLKREVDDLGKALKFCSNSLNSSVKESIDPEYDLNIYAILFYLLRCGLVQDCLHFVKKWKDIEILPSNEEFLVELFTDLFHGKSIKQYSTNATQVLVEILQNQDISPWKLGLFQLFEGSNVTNERTKLIYSTIQDYIWQNVFIHSHVAEMTNIGEDIVKLGFKYFQNIGNEWFYAKLLILTHQLEKALLFLYNSLRQDISKVFNVVHLLLCLKKAEVIEDKNSVELLKLKNIDMKELLLHKVIYEYSYQFINTKLLQSILYISTLKEENVIVLLSYLIVESKKFSYLFDNFKFTTTIPSLYSKRTAPKQNIISLEDINKRQGVLYKLKSFETPIVEKIIEYSVNLTGQALGKFNLLIRSSSPAKQQSAVNILTEQLILNEPGNVENVWFEIVPQLQHFPMVKSLLLPFVNFNKGLVEFDREVESSGQVFQSYIRVIETISSVFPIDVNQIDKSIHLLKTKLSIKLYIKLLTQFVQVTLYTCELLKKQKKLESYSYQLKAIVQSLTTLFTKLQINDTKIAELLTKLQLLL